MLRARSLGLAAAQSRREARRFGTDFRIGGATFQQYGALMTAWPGCALSHHYAYHKGAP